ncbi:MAG: TIGR01777 family oxidoreductase [Burkholderiales bacterium]|nr:TIGR01777 family oxidoreductase [Burkholderiales bacterium]
MKNILITGSSGYIATNFIKKFAEKYNFICLSHKKIKDHIILEDLYSNNVLVNSIDVIVNLAGANISAKRWSLRRKQELLQSRLLTTQKIVSLFNSLDKKPHLISASAVGIYPQELINDEFTTLDYQDYENFSQEITKKWEVAAHQYQGALTITRFGVVFGSEGGAFPQMLKPFLFYTGSVLASGLQYMPWIALPDLLNTIDYVISNQQTGIYNFVAPNMVNNRQLAMLITKIWNKPIIGRIPKFVIKILFGQMGEELFLNSIKVLPTRLINENFIFMYPDLSAAMIAIKNKVF